MERAGTVSWAFQLVRDGLRLESGKVYSLSFSARADTPRMVSVNLWEDRPPYRWLGVTQNIRLTTEWKQYTVGIRPVGGKIGQVRLSFNMSNEVGTVQIGEPALRAGGTIAAPLEWSLRGGVPFIDARYEPIFAARRDFARFLGDIESKHVNDWRQFLKNDLKVQVPIWHSQAQFGGWGGLLRESNSDAIDNHVYWKHPELLGGWTGGWRIENASMATQPLNDPLAIYSMLRVPGKPSVVSEWNSGQPTDFGAESLLMAASLGAHQDWAGIWVFDYHSANTYDRDKIEGFFSIDSHPLKMATAPLAALIFRRGDVRVATTSVNLAFSPDKEWEEVANTPSGPSLNQFTKTWNASGAPRGATLTGRVNILNSASAYISPSRASLETPNVFVSDTGEIVRDAKNGLWSVNSSLSKAWAGNWGSRRAKLGEAEIWFNGAPKWSAGSLSSLDGRSIAQSKRMLLVVAGRAENVNMGWNAQRNSVGGQWGNGPTYVGTTDATFKLATSARFARVWALDERGQRRATVPVTLRDGVIKFKSSPVWRTVWYEIETS